MEKERINVGIIGSPKAPTLFEVMEKGQGGHKTDSLCCNHGLVAKKSSTLYVDEYQFLYPDVIQSSDIIGRGDRDKFGNFDIEPVVNGSKTPNQLLKNKKMRKIKNKMKKKSRR